MLSTDIHPLALEDVLHQRGQSRSKVDYYSKHLFLRILCHQLGDPDELNPDPSISPAYGSTLTDLPRSSSPSPFTENDKASDHDGSYEKEENSKGEETGEDLTMYNGSAPNSRYSTKRNKRRRPLLPHHRRDFEGTIKPRSELSRFAGIQRNVSPTFLGSAGQSSGLPGSEDRKYYATACRGGDLD